MHSKIKNNDENIPFIRDLCPHLNEKELKEAEESLLGYVETALKIFSRLESIQQPDSDATALTGKGGKDRIISNDMNGSIH